MSDYTCPFHDWQDDTKICTKNHELYEREACSFHGPNSILCCFEVHWLFPRERLSLGTLPQRDPMNQHSYADLK